MTQDEIVGLAEHCPGLTVYTPLPKERDDVTARPCASGSGYANTSLTRCGTGGRGWRARLARRYIDGAS